MIPFGMQPLMWPAGTVATATFPTVLLVQPKAADVAAGSYLFDATGKWLGYSGGAVLSSAAVLSGGASLATGSTGNPAVDVTPSADFALGTGDFTLEIVFRRTGGTYSQLVQGYTSTSSTYWGLYLDPPGTLILNANGAGTIVAGGSAAMNIDHTVYVRRIGSAFTLGLDQTVVATGTYSGALDQATGGLRLFSPGPLNAPFYGAIYALRLRRDATLPLAAYTTFWT